MPKAWLCVPAARDEGESTVGLWREAGYGVALFRDEGAPHIEADVRIIGKYPGYAQAVNELCHEVLGIDKDCLFCVAGGDDVQPEPRYSTEQIVTQLAQHFNGTFGVCQFTGDRWHEGKGGFENAPIDRVCGSPWMGREFCRRMYGGKGPLFEGYQHQFVDEELQEVALKLGVLWQRRDLTHKHMHWGRGATDQTVLNDPKIPPHLEKWNTTEHWQTSKKLFAERKRAGFPGSEPI